MRVVAIGGWDPSGRAGVLADVDTIARLGAEACAVVTCITAQGAAPKSTPVGPKLIAAQLDAVGHVDAVKVGAVPDARSLAAIMRWLDARRVPAVIDPVTVTSRGLRLSTLKSHAAAARDYAVLTPNRSELGSPLARRPGLPGWARSTPGFGAVVVKSITPGTDAVFVTGKRPIYLRGAVLKRSRSHRGTGCRFSSAMAVDLASGHTVVHAAKTAKRFVRKFLSGPIIGQL